MNILWVFYKKLIIPSLAISILLAILFTDSTRILSGIGIAYIFLTPCMQFLLYDLARPNEYYFYFNLGMSRFNLWLNSVVVSLVIGLFLIMI